MKKDANIWILDKKQSMIIRAICCFLVVMVHIPAQHGNFIQDMLGSFGFISVTIFFMLSSYGLKYSLDYKENYLKNFWKNRILTLLIPFWIINILMYYNVKPIDLILILLGIKNKTFISDLIIYYIFFWLVNTLIKNRKHSDYLICITIFIYALLGKILNYSTGYFVESLGLVYGIIIYHAIPKIKNIANKINQKDANLMIGGGVQFTNIFKFGPFVCKI